MAKPMPPFVAHVLDLFAFVGGALRTGAMFGGWGFWRGDQMFALATGDVLYLKTDEHNRQSFVDAGCEPFRFDSPRGTVEISYYRPPEVALEAEDEMRPWARGALEAAARKAAQKKPATAKKPTAKKPTAKKPTAKKRTAKKRTAR